MVLKIFTHGDKLFLSFLPSSALQNLTIMKVGKAVQDPQVQLLTQPHRAHCPRPSVPHPHSSGTPPGMVTPPPPWAAVPLQHCSLGEEYFPNIQPDPPLAQHEVISNPFQCSCGHPHLPCTPGLTAPPQLWMCHQLWTQQCPFQRQGSTAWCPAHLLLTI